MTASGTVRPSISVVTATRNCAATVETLYRSLAAQTCPDFEWVVMDGQSTDGTTERLRSLASQSPWIKVTSERDFGLYDALNKGIAKATADHYVVAGADDAFAADAIEHFAVALRVGDPDVVLAHVLRNGREIGGFKPARAWLGHASVFGGSHSVGMLIRRSLHDRFGWYSRRFPLLADGYFLKQLLRAGSVRFVDASFVAGMFAEGGLTSVNKLQILAETWQIQMLTESSPVLQTLLFTGKLLVRFPQVLQEMNRLERNRPVGERHAVAPDRRGR